MIHVKTCIYGFIIGDSIFNNNMFYTSSTIFMLSTIESIIQRKIIDPVNILNKMCTSLILNKYSIDGKIIKINSNSLKVLNTYSEKNKLVPVDNNEIDSLSRLIPIIIYYNKHNRIDLLDNIIKITSITHDNEDVILCNYLFVIYSLNLLNGLDKFDSLYIEIPNYFKNKSLYKDIFKNKIKYKELKFDNSIMDSMKIILYILLNTNSFEECIIKLKEFDNSSLYASYTLFLSTLIYKSNTIFNKYKTKLKNKDIIYTLLCDFERTIK